MEIAMDEKFAVLVEALAPKLTRLLAMSPLKYGQLPHDMPDCSARQELTRAR